jgi:diguanylate cyclase (GGDEF)-like protein
MGWRGMDILTKTEAACAQSVAAMPIRTLLVEPDHEDARMLRALAIDAGEEFMSLEWTDSLTVGMELLHEERYDILLLSLAALHNQHTLDSIQEQNPGIPIILLGHQKDDGFALRAIQAGAQDVLPRDHIDGYYFIRSIQYAIERQNILSSLQSSRTLERYLAYHDTLTKLPNRQLFLDRLTQSLAHARRNDTSVAVLFIDLDGFKEINDTMGHSAGDLLLMAFAERLRSCVRESETASRFGGDEFAVILNDIDSEQDAAVVAQRILDSLDQPLMLGNKECAVGTSIGISIYPSDGSSADSLIRHADTAMYLAKQKGGHRYLFYAPSLNRDFPRELSHVKNIRRAIDHGQLTLYFQPQLDLGTGRIVCVEALLRWMHPNQGVIGPDQFIPAAEKSGLIVPIGAYVLRRACEQGKKWQEQGLPAVRIAVNLSMRQLRHCSLLEQINGILEETSMNPALLDLEITENSALHQNQETIHLLEALKARGIQLSIDDFGIGYSSLGHLKRLPVQMLKIDRSFVINMNRDSEDVAIIRAIISMAHSLGIRVTAEGVETREQLEILRSLNCDAIQGYHFSRPVPADKVEDLLRRYGNKGRTTAHSGITLKP